MEVNEDQVVFVSTVVKAGKFSDDEMSDTSVNIKLTIEKSSDEGEDTFEMEKPADSIQAEWTKGYLIIDCSDKFMRLYDFHLMQRIREYQDIVQKRKFTGVTFYESDDDIYFVSSFQDMGTIFFFSMMSQDQLAKEIHWKETCMSLTSLHFNAGSYSGTNLNILVYITHSGGVVLWERERKQDFTHFCQHFT